MEPEGYLGIVLHAHLPFVKHPEYEFFLEEDWLYEAITETYIPLYYYFSKLLEEGVKFRISLTISPSLAAMLSDELLQKRYLREINKLIELSEKELIRTKNTPFFDTAKHYNEKFKLSRYIFEEKLGKNLLTGFKELQDAGVLEILTVAATHGFLPYMQSTPYAVAAQIKVGVNEYIRHFERKPYGIWLPECGYYPGVEKFLKENDIRYFIVDSHGIMFATPRPKYGVYAPVFTKSGVAAFGRDPECSKQVWSSKEGYPGDFDYREFYRDIGYDLDFEYIKDYIQPTGHRKNTGIKYYRITGPTDHKEPYVREKALEKAALHAGNFMFNREQQVKYLSSMFDRKPYILAPFDAELFGHWWYEGPEFLYYLIKKIYYDQNTMALWTPSDYLKNYETNQLCSLSMSTWGDKGYGEVWLNGKNDWIYRHLHVMRIRMNQLANTFKNPTPLQKRALNQCARELLLAESSDWPFIITTNTMVEYAKTRIKTHILRFNELYEQLINGNIDETALSAIEYQDSLFPEIDYTIYRS